MFCNATITTPSPVIPQNLVLKTPNNYDTGSAFILSATGFFSPKFRVGEGTKVSQSVFISDIYYKDWFESSEARKCGGGRGGGKGESTDGCSPPIIF